MACAPLTARSQPGGMLRANRGGCWVGQVPDWKMAPGGTGVQGTATRPPSLTAGPGGASLSWSSSQKRRCTKFHPTLRTQDSLKHWVSRKKQEKVRVELQANAVPRNRRLNLLSRATGPVVYAVRRVRSQCRTPSHRNQAESKAPCGLPAKGAQVSPSDGRGPKYSSSAARARGAERSGTLLEAGRLGPSGDPENRRAGTGRPSPGPGRGRFPTHSPRKPYSWPGRRRTRAPSTSRCRTGRWPGCGPCSSPG